MKPAIRTSLDVGFPKEEMLPLRLAWRGREWREIGAVSAFPFEDNQFQVVLLHSSVLASNVVREAHRVLIDSGLMVFRVLEQTKKCDGFTLPKIYSIVRDGFDIIEVDRTAWWKFWEKERTLTIVARKKAWKSLKNTYRPYVVT